MAQAKVRDTSSVTRRSAAALRPATRASKSNRTLMRLVDDGRSSRACMLRKTKDGLISSLPSAAVTPVAVALAERYAIIALRLAEMDRAALEDGEGATKDYIALSGHAQRLLRQFAALGRTKPVNTGSPLLAALAEAGRQDAAA